MSETINHENWRGIIGRKAVDYILRRSFPDVEMPLPELNHLRDFLSETVGRDVLQQFEGKDAKDLKSVDYNVIFEGILPGDISELVRNLLINLTKQAKMNARNTNRVKNLYQNDDSVGNELNIENERSVIDEIYKLLESENLNFIDKSNLINAIFFELNKVKNELITFYLEGYSLTVGQKQKMTDLLGAIIRDHDRQIRISTAA